MSKAALQALWHMSLALLAVLAIVAVVNGTPVIAALLIGALAGWGMYHTNRGFWWQRMADDWAGLVEQYQKRDANERSAKANPSREMGTYQGG